MTEWMSGLLADWLSQYRDPMFGWVAVATPLLSALAFLLFAGPFTWLAMRDTPQLRRYRIQARRARKQDVIVPSLKSWALNNTLMLAVAVIAWPILRRFGIHLGPFPAGWADWGVIAAQVLFFVYLDDALYYFVHRLMHTRWLYRHIHRTHHRIITPWAITGHFMHPAEYVATGMLSLVGPLMLGVGIIPLWIWVVVRQWEAAEGHSGYQLPWVPMHLLPFCDGARHHDFHHAKVRGNYAGFLRHMDALLGTYAAGYRDRRRHEAVSGETEATPHRASTAREDMAVPRTDATHAPRGN